MLNFAIETAKEAGHLLLEKFGKRIGISKKGEINLVTEADLAAEKLIINRIRTHHPRHSILAEESGEAVRIGDNEWWRGKIVRPDIGIDPAFEISVTGKDGAGDNVIVADGF